MPTSRLSAVSVIAPVFFLMGLDAEANTGGVEAANNLGGVLAAGSGLGLESWCNL